MELQNRLSFILGLGVLLILSGCLPMQKMTQCGENEAFNSSSRKCLPVIGAASSDAVYVKSKVPSNSYTSSVNGSTVSHEMVVSDVYNYGYATKWYVHFSNGSSSTTNMVASNSLIYSFKPPNQYGAGDYIIEAVVYDQQGSTPIDSVSWNIKLIDLTAPSLKNPSPASSSFSYSTNVTSATIAVDLDNPDGLSGFATWLVDGATVSSPNFNSATTGFSTTINPQALGLGIHTVEIRIADSSNNMYESFVWVINAVNPDLPVFGSADPTYNHTIVAIDTETYNDGGFLYDHDSDTITELENIATKTQTGDTPGICVTVDDWDKNNDGTADVYLVFDINGSQQGAQIDMTSNTYCFEGLTTQFLTNSEVGASKTLSVSSYKYGTTTLLEQKSWAMNVLPKNPAPIIKISSNTDDFGCSEDSDVYHTGCSVTQSVDNDLNGLYTDAGDVDNVIKVAIDVLEDFGTDYNDPTSAHGEDKSEVYFQIKKSADAAYQDVDGNSDYTKASCVTGQISKSGITDSSTPSGAVTTYYCNLSLDAFNDDGPIESGSYVLKAFITDAGSKWGGTDKDSNHVRWEMTVDEYQSAPEIQEQDFANTTPEDDNESYLTSADSSCVDSGTVLHSGNQVNEGDYVVLHTVVKDLERDHMTLSVKMENLVNGADSYSTVSSLQSVTRNDDAEYYTIETCFKVPEWANNSSAQADVGIRVTVNDVPDDSSTAESVSNIGSEFYLNVENVNPAPEFADASDVDLNGKTVFPGHPFSLTPPSYTDASSTDGANVTWQWQVCVGNPATGCAVAGANWADIPNANSDNQSSEELVWTPDPSIATNEALHLRLCLGDDGDGNPADCTKAVSTKTYVNLEAKSNSKLLVNTSSANEVASWFDETGEFQYVAYAAGTDIHIEKLANDDNGNWTSVHSIFFASDTVAPKAVYDLSMTGKSGVSLLVSYRIYENSTNNPVMRVRRIDISNDKLSFNYAGLYDSASPLQDMVENGLSNSVDSEVGGNKAQMDIQFTAVPADGDTIEFGLSDGSTVTFEFDNDFVGTDPGTTATDLANAINDHADLQKEISASDSGDTVTISGPAAGDYLDLNGELALYLGNIAIQDLATDRWLLPFADGSNNLKTTLLIGSDPSLVLGTLVPSTLILNTKTSVSEMRIANQDTNGNMILAVKAGVNLHMYRFSNALSLIDSLENVFNMNDFDEIQNISLAIDNNGASFVAGVSKTTSGDTYLNSAVFDDADLSDFSATSRFTGYSNYLAQSGIDKVAITADSGGKAIIALTTNAAHKEDDASASASGIPNQAHFLAVSVNTADLANSSIMLSDYRIATSESSPKVNINSSHDGGGIALSPIINMIKGHSNENSGAAADNAQPSVFFTFHENNAGSAEIRTGIYNISSEDLSTDDPTVDGSYPAFLSN